LTNKNLQKLERLIMKKMVKTTLVAFGILTGMFVSTDMVYTEYVKHESNQKVEKVQQEEKVKTITEEFEITEVSDNGEVRGELTKGTGEGIFYHISHFQNWGIEVEEGKVIQMTWLEKSYNEGDWENIAEIKEVK
jgi:hypothetical protein